ncbi:hypothetical protein LEP1GSC055_0775 [Leptospira borgpetersenii str. Brem 307]|uniref:Uncharacterized protein n=1 Tax=Leptospira borgpetersenii str. Brem 328 TaxID=1049780 RepID=A0ABC9SIF7_LEPBO|nr:hypothetical protein LEP1GSC055_0775 [Leptospira borgpetersenii str. Brem 307]EMN17593.1 hypothetical protein LEP1GSC056_2773 [Leptospira borgpetersenii str. Brem 328]
MNLESVPKPFDLIGILVDHCNCSYVLGQTLRYFIEHHKRVMNLF